MSSFDGSGEIPNIPFPTGGGTVFWENLVIRGGYSLQRHRIDGHCRILDEKNIRVAWGNEGAMRAKMEQLAPRPKTFRPQYGDVIGVHRLYGVYDHYGVYESDECIYEYAARDGDFGDADIHITTLQQFVRDSQNLFVLTFPDNHGKPGKHHITSRKSGIAGVPMMENLAWSALKKLIGSGDYYLYSPEETIQRARSRLGERKYNLAFNNCEHYALWCKTGIHESHQVNTVLDLLKRRILPLPIF